MILITKTINKTKNKFNKTSSKNKEVIEILSIFYKTFSNNHEFQQIKRKTLESILNYFSFSKEITSQDVIKGAQNFKIENIGKNMKNFFSSGSIEISDIISLFFNIPQNKRKEYGKCVKFIHDKLSKILDTYKNLMISLVKLKIFLKKLKIQEYIKPERTQQISNKIQIESIKRSINTAKCEIHMYMEILAQYKIPKEYFNIFTKNMMKNLNKYIEQFQKKLNQNQLKNYLIHPDVLLKISDKEHEVIPSFSLGASFNIQDFYDNNDFNNKCYEKIKLTGEIKPFLMIFNLFGISYMNKIKELYLKDEEIKIIMNENKLKSLKIESDFNLKYYKLMKETLENVKDLSKSGFKNENDIFNIEKDLLEAKMNKEICDINVFFHLFNNSLVLFSHYLLCNPV